ncbi:myrosinase 1-like [Melitaea cinxia]|uniref:myrosinase 1-like n=1 Tax=Melitaea cinxia TaxID=113334 RepID=UPI001E274840|nr:myrosinase 1-like [Melitaea cinxia]
MVCAVVGGRDFPPGFKFGAATAAYQIEGAWNVSDKSPSVWDSHVHANPDRIIDRSNGDVASDSYYKWKDDIEIASKLGLHFYRFSIAWSRLLPKGFANYISEDGKKYYNDLIDGLLEKGIEPLITLYHWDLPQVLQDLGGWTNPLISDWFADYARVAYSLFGDRVKIWITLNEPVMFCDIAYNTGALAPGVYSPGRGSFLCNKHSMIAHAKAYRIYDEEFRPKYNGKVSLANQIMWFEPATEDDVEITEIARQFMAGMYSHPIFSKEGGWPPVMERIIAEKSKKEGLNHSRLPPLTQEEIELIRGTYDFFGLNFYTSRTVLTAKEEEKIGPWPYKGSSDIDVHLTVKPEWKNAGTKWFFIYPEGLRKLLVWLKKEYGDMEIFITENGLASYDIGLDDHDRVEYYKEHLEQVLLAIQEDEVKVTAYTAWTLIDNFEWLDGYRSKFGLYQVDYEDPERKRTPRASAHYYASVIKCHSLDIDNIISDEL